MSECTSCLGGVVLDRNEECVRCGRWRPGRPNGAVVWGIGGMLVLMALLTVGLAAAMLL